MEEMILNFSRDMINMALKNNAIINKDGRLSYIMGVKYSRKLNKKEYSELFEICTSPSNIVESLRKEFKYLDIVEVHIAYDPKPSEADIINLTIYIDEFTSDKLVGTVHRVVKWIYNLFK